MQISVIHFQQLSRESAFYYSLKTKLRCLFSYHGSLLQVPPILKHLHLFFLAPIKPMGPS